MAKKKTKKKKKKGFTLIELLIVIAIIGILASIVLVSLSSAREKAKISSFKAQVHSMQSAATLTCDDVPLDDTNVTGPDVAGGGVSYIGTITIDPANVDCGPDGANTFSFTVDAANLAAACAATVSDTGVSFDPC